ncbi:hypothetical protein LR002_02200, partial [Candidatus Gracilibacteria bacterium]|nr:hypothetical protein [Candidatus Gracilibacteria bacterium]
MDKKLEKLQQFYKFSEITFFGMAFFAFGLGLLMKNGTYNDLTNFLFNFIYFPFVFFAISYGLLSLRFYLDKGENEVIDN